MCQFALCRGIPKFQLKYGPLGQPPEGGWKIQSLPDEAESLRFAWAAHPDVPENPESAFITLLDFLALNGFSSPEITKWAYTAGPRQWCSVHPERCDKKWRPEKAGKTRFFPWARKVWEDFNNALHDGQDDVRRALEINTAIATALISSPSGCPHCSTHWTQVLSENPPPLDGTLAEARQWLVKVHNLTREGHDPVPFETIAAKFNWTPE